MMRERDYYVPASISAADLELDYSFRANDFDSGYIATTLSKYSDSRNWLDLGCGPVLPQWATFVRNDRTQISGIDCVAQSTEFLEAQLQSRKLLPAHLRALKFSTSVLRQPALSPEDHRRTIFDRVSEVRCGNILDEYKDWRNRFDLITQIGCLGCMRTFCDVDEAVRILSGYLVERGRCVSITWVHRTNGVLDELGPEGPVTAEQLRALFAKWGLATKTVVQVPTVAAGYSALLIIETVRTF